MTDLRVAEILQNDGRFNVEFLTCDGVFPIDCTVRDYLNLGPTPSKEDIDLSCQNCRVNSKIAQIELRYKAHTLRDVQSQVPRVEEIIEKEKTNFGPDYIYDGVPLGKIAIYELLLKWKKTNMEFSARQSSEILAYVENSLRTFLISEVFLSMNHPEKILIFNPQYSVPGAFASAAMKKGIQTLYFSNSGTISEMRTQIKIWDWEYFKLKNPALDSWKSSTVQISKNSKKRLKKYFLHQRNAISPWVYSVKSKGQDSRQFFKISPRDKIVLAVMNSTDEYFAAVTCGLLPPEMSHSFVFENQEKWIFDLIEWAKGRGDVSLVIRPHPRELPNKREGIRGEAVDLRRGLFENLPENVYVDLPEGKFAIEDHFEATSVVTTGWSSVGLDWQMRGKICVTYDQNLPMYPPDTHLSGESREAYFRNLDTALSMSRPDIQKLQRQAKNWYQYSNFIGSARLISSLFDIEQLQRVWKYTLINSISYRFLPNQRKKFEIKVGRLNSDTIKISELFINNKKSFFDN